MLTRSARLTAPVLLAAGLLAACLHAAASPYGPPSASSSSPWSSSPSSPSSSPPSSGSGGVGLYASDGSTLPTHQVRASDRHRGR